MPALPPLRLTKERLWLGGAGLLLWLVVLAGDLLGAAERFAYDHALTGAARAGSPEVVVVAIDAPSQARHGSWPWSRELHGRLVDRLRGAGARVVAHAEPFIGAQSTSALAEWHRIASTVAADPALAHHPDLPTVLSVSREHLDGDGQFAHSLAAHGRSLLALGPLEPAPLRAGEAMAALVDAEPTAAGANAAAPARPPWPLPLLARAALGSGHLELDADRDGRLRRHALRRDVDGRGIASLAWLAASVQRGLPPDPPAQGGRWVSLGSTRLPLGPLDSVAPIFAADRPQQPAFVHLSADAVLGGQFNARAVAGKLVLIGRVDHAARAGGVLLPDGEPVAPVEALAQLSSALLTGQVVAQPGWARGLPWLLAIAAVAYLVWLAPRLTAGSGLALSSLVALCLLLGAQLGLSAAHIWSPMVLPATVLLLGHLSLLGLRRHAWRAGQTTVTPLVPLPAGRGALGDTCASTAAGAASTVLAVEAGRPGSPVLPQLEQPAGVSHGDLRPATRPVALPVALSAALPGALAALPAGAPGTPHHPAADLSMAATQPLHEREANPATQPAAMYRARGPGGAPPPRLGAYQLEHEIGRGTMGRVYLASEIGHGGEVAVKTLALAREFEGFALREARARFQREAQAAGRLQHPDIVRVLQSGEERGLAYIAMERLHGHDLTRHVQPGTLLSVGTVVAIGARVAAALAHAHRQGVIHRDIKPANVMIDPEHGQVKVTDFGIARITDSARTRTGLVLGSPSYMSPEQLTGRSVDGRSDLYSLGVLLFQLLTGRLPQQGHTLAEMIQAATQEVAPDVRQLNPLVPEAVANIVNILLQKRAELRYGDGDAVAVDLRLVGAWLLQQRRERAEADAAASVQDCALPAQPSAGSRSAPARDGAQSAP